MLGYAAETQPVNRTSNLFESTLRLDVIHPADDRAAALACYYKYIKDAHPKHDPLKDLNLGEWASFLLECL